MASFPAILQLMLNHALLKLVPFGCPTAARKGVNHVLQGRMNRKFPEMNLSAPEERSGWKIYHPDLSETVCELA
jgi:hypothetical protein